MTNKCLLLLTNNFLNIQIRIVIAVTKISNIMINFNRRYLYQLVHRDLNVIVNIIKWMGRIKY